VYLAQAPGSKQMVAIKEMLVEHESGLSVAEQVARFKREAEIHMGLQHPNIVPCLDSGIEGDRHYLVMEYQAGHSWHSMLEDTHERQNLTLPRIVELGAQLCKALHYMHEHGVVHRDIKPSNLLISPIGQLKVTDFGMARRSFGPGITQSKMMLGTLNYMSPEQLLDATSVDGRSDVFAAGVILYKTLTGQLPFAAQNATEVAHNLLYSDPPAPNEINPLLPDALAEKLLKALNKDPDFRYLSSESLGKDLDAELANPELYVCQGKAYMQDKAWRNAKESFEHAINLENSHGCAWYGLGESYEALGEEEQALECYLKVVALDSSRVDAYQRLGRIYCKQQNAQAAIKMLQRAWVLNPQDRDTCFLLGKTHADLGQRNEAIDQFTLMTQNYPDWAEAHFELGRVLYKEGMQGRALTAFTQAAALAPTHPEMLFNLASLNQEMNDLDKARVNYEALVQLQPEHAHARHNLACCQYALGHLKDAESELKHTLELKPTWSQTWYVLGHLMDSSGRGQAALEAFQRAYELNPANVDIALTLGQTLYRQYQPNAAIDIFAAAAAQPGDHQSTAYFFLAQTYRVKGMNAEAIEALHRCLRANPDRDMTKTANELLKALGSKASTFSFPTGPSTGRVAK
jgi:serine/threonine-protein kinase